MLERNPSEGAILDRLWKWHEARGTTSALLQSFAQATTGPRALLHGHLLRKAGQPDAARAAYERAAELDPASPAPWLALADLAGGARAAEPLSRALERLPAADSQRAAILVKLGQARQDGGDSAGAAKAWEEAATLNPADIALQFSLARTLENAGETARARQLLERVASQAPPAERLEALRLLAQSALTADDFPAAQSALQRALELAGPSHWLRPELQQQLIRLHQRSGREEELVAAWTAAAEAAPRDLPRLLRLADLFAELADPAREAVWLEKALALVPREREMRTRLARQLAGRGEWAKAAEQYDELLRQAARPSSELILARAELDVQLGRTAEAVARVKALLDAPNRDEAAAAAALTFLQRHRFDAEAEQTLRAARDRAPQEEGPTIALVEFLAGQRRAAAVRTELERWTAARPGEAVGVRAARLERAADFLRSHAQPEAAAQTLAEAVRIDPQSPAARRLALAECQLQLSDFAAARRTAQEAYIAARTPAEKAEADERLYQAVLGPANANQTSTAPGKTLVPARDLPEVREFLAGLAQAARGPKATVEDTLRLARLQARAGAPEDGIETAMRLVRQQPTNVPARELVARLAAETGRQHVVVDMLRSLMEIDAPRAAQHRRALALARLDRREFDEAIPLLEERVRAEPGSAEALIDLASAFQRAERWFDAATYWERAYAAGNARQRGDIRPQYISALEKVGNRQRAAELLAGAQEAVTDPARQLEAFRELTVYCANAGLLDWLAGRAEARVKAAPADYQALAALAEVRKAQRRDDDAWELLRKARFTAGQPVAALQNLVETAEERGDLSAAVEQQRRLTQLPGEATIPNLERLAGLEESALELDAAGQTWERLMARFPRDPTLLGRAAEFFRRMRDVPRERQALRAAARLDATDVQRLLRLAALDRQAGDLAGARAALEQFLASTETPAATGALVLPVDIPDTPASVRPASARRASGGSEVSPNRPPPEVAARLEAIRELAQIIAQAKDPAAEAAWIERWRHAASPSEMLAAWFHVGRADLVLDWLEPKADGPPTSPPVRGFAAVALQGRLFARLGEWVHGAADGDRQAQRRTVLLEGLDLYLRTIGGRPTPEGLVEGLFPPQHAGKTKFWGDSIARVFVGQHRYREATQLAAPVLASLQTHRASLGVELARWHLLLGEREAAIGVLRFATEGRNPAETFEAIWFEAVRMLYLLLPPAERADYAGRMQRVAEEGGPAQATLTTAWLAALAGDEPTARPALERWLALRPAIGRDPDQNFDGGRSSNNLTRHFAAVLASGQRLEAIGRPALALHLWEKALAALPPGVTDDDDRLRDTVREVRHRSRLLAWTLATPGEAEILVNDYLARKPALDEVSSLATALQGRQDNSLALRLRRWLQAAEPGNAEYWRSLHSALRSTGDWTGLRESLLRSLSRVTPAPSAIGRRDVVLQLIDAEEKLGNLRDAREQILAYLAIAPRDNYLRQRLAQNFERAGLTEDAAAAWRVVLERESDHPLAAIALSQLEEKRGNRAESLRLLETLQRRGAAFSPDAAARLLKLYVRAEPAKARELARSQLRLAQYHHLPRTAEILAAEGEAGFARELLTLGIQRCREPQQRFQLAQALLEKHAPEPAQSQRALRRLRLLADQEPRLLSSYQAARAAYFTQREEPDGLVGALQADWDQGDVQAGQRLVPALAVAGRKEEARKALYTYLARPDAIVPNPESGAQPLMQVASQLQAAGAPDLALEIYQRLYRRFPQNGNLALARAGALLKLGATAEGRAAIADVELRWLITPAVLRLVAATCLEHDLKPAAIAALQQLVRTDPRAESPLDHQQLALLLAKSGDAVGARRAMQTSYRSGPARTLGPLLDLLEALPGQALEAPVNQIAGDYHLRADLRRELPAALAVRLFKLGRAKAARAALAQRPLTLFESGEALAPLRESATTEAEFAETERIFRDALLQAPGERARLAREAALFALRWARHDWAEQRPERAFEHLKKASAWQPQEWSVAEQACEWRLERGEKALARAALNEFLTSPLAPTAERAQAQERLAALR
ncbi:MAG: hypothetical protein JSR82_22965 [Verrucomicrobia bacterium]|nr:hypothetical protein [Verrucomicrobiota bacterium]